MDVCLCGKISGGGVCVCVGVGVGVELKGGI